MIISMLIPCEGDSACDARHPTAGSEFFVRVKDSEDDLNIIHAVAVNCARSGETSVTRGPYGVERKAVIEHLLGVPISRSAFL
jgi:hypothetical protein